MIDKYTIYHGPCPKCPSSDAYCEWEDGHGHCYSCEYHKPPDQSFEDETSVSYQYIAARGLTKETMEFYGIVTKVNSDGKPIAHGFPYSPEAIKIRSLINKDFISKGEMSNVSLFGKDKFSPGSAKAITLTEGEYDAASVYQMLGSKWPAVSIRSAATAKKDCINEREYINSFEKIYLCFDNDEAGKRATREVASLFDFNKVYSVFGNSSSNERYKDANDFLQAGRADEYTRCWYNSQRFLPEGIISSFSDIGRLVEEDKVKAIATYPFDTLEEYTYGIRPGEVNLFTAFEGVGKTEFFRAIEYHLLKTTEENIGLIHLEEDKVRTIKGIAGYELKTPAHLPNEVLSKEDIKNAYQRATGKDDRLHLYSHFGSDDPDIILDTILFLVSSCGCKFIFLDHLTMVVTGLEEVEERRTLDYITTRLAMMVRERKFTLFMISHVNDEGKTRGSRNISKVADLHVHLERDIFSANQKERQTTNLLIKKNRYAGKTGPAGRLYFDASTFILSDKHIDLPPLKKEDDNGVERPKVLG